MTASELNFLVVEDDDFQRRMVVTMLHSLGAAEVREAGNGRQALEMLHAVHTRPVDIVLCDMDMPEMDGMAFLRHLGQENNAAAVIILSMLDRVLLVSVEKMSEAYGVKLLGAVEKPLTRVQLEALILRYERGSRAQRPHGTVQVFTLEEIRQGMKAKQFEPYFQPKVDMKTGRLMGAEALARWIHPEYGVITPYAFIPLLEKAKEMDELTFMMLEKSVAACRSLQDKGHSLVISINLSLTSLTDITLADRITQGVLDAGVDPRAIVLEITESAAMTDVAHALENLARLRMHGFGLSIDDFGTGYSSMQQLMRIAFSELKIDQSFVKDIASNESLRIVVESSIGMARKLRVKSVAEGVETQQDWEILKTLNCDIAQGYFIAKPMNLDAFMDHCAVGDQ
ncbi:EAL domain-containing response regulator [Ferrovum myxofaciens]|jgi:EAL domain-containing protein (putative c-di-GMP-specific phosphodiesterase class I)/FixJ family two-component response regulator|uniref:EAL domain-containing response regulator n=1 Tax=Ferrovum myxofaciens TaxID=416213 RepID=A0A859A8B4_9PROT|nr:EAL domain-containing response regulator [Ferrovum myxofaciens]MBW8029333.1 EAL domain-containing protein [Ferrovum sp.]KXW57978.1 phytochrome-like protein cph2 [Ferrovum myxofaciens]MBU6994399.1 EAL domain-containing response regulator [Ferrovum myxofaciens]NDU89567.1 EAL domain-containing response regulator [Ferrovum sp.]QKE38292.1 MAG: EAL domain-containing response regulator [Ferrovum myxofaciens]